MIPPLALQEALDAKKPGRSHDSSIILHISLLDPVGVSFQYRSHDHHDPTVYANDPKAMHFSFQRFQVNMYESWIFVRLQAARPEVLVFFHILHGETANCDEASQLAIWLHNSREAEKYVGGSLGLTRSWSMVTWFQAFSKAGDEIAAFKNHEKNALAVFKNASRFRHSWLAVQWLLGNHSLPLQQTIVPDFWTWFKAERIIYFPLHLSTWLNSRVSCICFSSNFPCTNPFHIGILPPSSPQTFCRFTKGLVEACWWPTSQVAWLQHPNSSRWSVQDGDHRKELRYIEYLEEDGIPVDPVCILQKFPVYVSTSLKSSISASFSLQGQRCQHKLHARV